MQRPVYGMAAGKPIMTIPAISWPELWAIYRRSPEPVEKEILLQLNLPDILAYASKKTKKEILDEAPVEIREEFEPTHIINFNPYMGLTKDELMGALFGAKAGDVQRRIDTPREHRQTRRSRFGLFGRCR